MFKAIWERLVGEPVASVALIQAGLAVAVGFGLNITTEQMGLILALTATLLGWLARRQVTPVSSPNLPPPEV